MLFPGGRAFKIVPGSGYIAIPIDAVGINPTPVSYASSTGWAEIIASTADEYFLCGVGFGIGVVGTSARESEIEIGIGASSSEVVIAEVGLSTTLSQNSSENMSWFTYPYKIPAGTRVACRVKANSSGDNRSPRYIKVMVVKTSEVVPV